MEQWQSVLYSLFESSIWRQIEDFTRKTSVTQELIVNDIHSLKIKPEDGGNNAPLKIRKIKKRYSFAYSTKKFYKNQIDTWQWTKDIKKPYMITSPLYFKKKLEIWATQKLQITSKLQDYFTTVEEKFKIWAAQMLQITPKLYDYFTIVEKN